MTDVRAAVAAAGRESYGRLVATLIGVTGDWQLAEDCAQEALVTALERWDADGIPGNPGGWLMTVARNRAVDALRRAGTERRKLAELARLPAEPPPPDRDDRLRLIFTCCHPALSLEARVALTLRTVAGLPTASIGRLFLVSEATMTRRLTRAKTKIAQAGIPYRVPEGEALTERLPGVLGVLYLLFTRGYDRDGTAEPATEAIRLARLLARLMPTEPEVRALLALFLLQHSRRDARVDEHGRPVTLSEQDRSRWDRPAIDEALALLPGSRGPYAIQAHIAACHVAERTDWARIAALYDELAALLPSPVVRLNRALAHGRAHGPAAGLALLADLRATGGLDGYAPALAAEADLTERSGDRSRAATLYDEAAAIAPSVPERDALRRRAVQLRSSL